MMNSQLPDQRAHRNTLRDVSIVAGTALLAVLIGSARLVVSPVQAAEPVTIPGTLQRAPALQAPAPSAIQLGPETPLPRMR